MGREEADVADGQRCVRRPMNSRVWAAVRCGGLTPDSCEAADEQLSAGSSAVTPDGLTVSVAGRCTVLA